MTKLKYQIKPKTQKFKVLSVKDLLKNSDAYILPYLFPSLARRFPFHFAPFGLTALTALRGVLLKNRRLVKVNLEVSSRIVFNFKP